MRYYDTFDSPHGGMLIAASENGITGVYFERQKYWPARRDGWQHAPSNVHLRKAKKQLAEYFAGKRREFTFPLDLRGTDFQRACWRALLAIPYGETRSYADVARAVGKPNAFRAVGMANNRNPLAIVVPCHRVIASDGTLCGYGGGLDVKRKLLELEDALTKTLAA